MITSCHSPVEKKMPPRKVSPGKRPMDKEGGGGNITYKEKRNKNNDAVKKSREKTRQKSKETMEKVSELKQVRNKRRLSFEKI